MKKLKIKKLLICGCTIFAFLLVIITYIKIKDSEEIEDINRISFYGNTEMVFKRSKANSESIEIAEKIVGNEIFLFDDWEPYKITKELTWTEDPYNDKTWKFYFHSLRMVSFLVNAYEETKDVKYLEKAKWYIESWVKSNPSPKKNVSDWAWSDHSTANRLMNILYFWNHYINSDIFSSEFQDFLIPVLIEHGKFLSNDKNYKNNNHGIFQDQALLELSVFFPDLDGSKEWKDKAIKRLLVRLNEDVSKSGVHREHSPSYHLVVLKLFLNIKEFMDYYNIQYPDELTHKLSLMQE